MKKIIEVRGLSYSYPDGRVALRDVDLDIIEGERVGIIGANGAGKTTLLLHLNGILQGDGQIKIFGMKMNKKNLRKIRSKVGIVFQDPEDQLFSPTVFDDVSFGPLNMKLPHDVVIERTKDALTQVGMKGFENRSPHHLSFGEKKRISIATVLSMKPEILLLDEPTSNLDPHLRRKLIGLLKGINSTMIIASHDLEMVLEICERVILLNEGKIVTGGKTKEVMGNKELMESNGLEVPLSLIFSTSNFIFDKIKKSFR